jgi:hypothetical protein
MIQNGSKSYDLKIRYAYTIMLRTFENLPTVRAGMLAIIRTMQTIILVIVSTIKIVTVFAPVLMFVQLSNLVSMFQPRFMYVPTTMIVTAWNIVETTPTAIMFPVDMIAIFMLHSVVFIITITKQKGKRESTFRRCRRCYE